MGSVIRPSLAVGEKMTYLTPHSWREELVKADDCSIHTSCFPELVVVVLVCQSLLFWYFNAMALEPRDTLSCVGKSAQVHNRGGSQNIVLSLVV